VRTRALTELSARELRPLLEEEAAHWGRELYWDYADVAAAVAASLERRALTGRALQEDGRPVAYCYYMSDASRAIVGSLFASEGYRGRGFEESLLDAVLSETQSLAGSDRVECQTLFSTSDAADARFSQAGFLGRRRHYLVRELTSPLPPPAAAFRLRPLRRDDIPAAARIVHRSHEGSVDAALNMTYATPETCRAFVETLMLRSGCGHFDALASLIADGGPGGAGVILISRLSRLNGHICQVSVTPECQGRGLGTQLVVEALEALRRQGLETASLSVTVGNRRAYELYERLGFKLRKEFAAHAWVRPPGRIELPA
jgi:ribosomal protein S18 acetylase RimI-like enzyme